MKCPNLSELPQPPEGRRGWPWTVESERAPAERRNGTPWPRISIVTPSYNQGQYLEETIRSVLLQGYPDIEYIIMDGGSTDGSVDVIRKYSKWIAHWESTKDNGQADAINKGLRQTTGEIFQFINSDDFLDQLAMQTVAERISDADCVSGSVVEFDEETRDQVIYASPNLTAINFVQRPPEFFYHQPGVWVRRECAVRLGGFDDTLHYKFDWEFMLRYFDRWPRVAYTDRNIGYSRLHTASKTIAQGERFVVEDWVARTRVVDRLISPNIRAALKESLGKKEWREKLDLAVAERRGRSVVTAASLLVEAMAKPKRRIDRYFLGAMRVLLIGR